MSKIINARLQTRSGTTAQWNALPNFVPLKGEQIVYLDYVSDPNNPGGYIPGVKIGDGNAYLVDLPFMVDNAAITNHINNSSIHVSTSDRANWNDNVSVEYDSSDEELIFT